MLGSNLGRSSSVTAKQPETFRTVSSIAKVRVSIGFYPCIRLMRVFGVRKNKTAKIVAVKRCMTVFPRKFGKKYKKQLQKITG
jgi:hypothetical protein